MERRVGLAIVTLGALSWAALAQSQSVVTLPLKPPPQKQAEGETVPEEQQTAPGKQAAAAPTKPPKPVAPQALFTLPPPAFTTEPLLPALVIEDASLPQPKLDSTLLETKERPAAAPPVPQPKPPAPNIAESVAPTAPAETKPRPFEMEPIDDYRPRSVIVDPSALDRTLLRKNEKAAAAPPMPRAKPAAVAAAGEAPQLDGGATESIGNDRPGTRLSLPPATATAAKPLMPRSKPVAQKPGAKTPAPGAMAPVDDIPGGKLYVAEPGKAPTFRCFVRDVMAFYDRTHIRCYNKARSKLNFFAVDTNQPVAATVLEKGLAAMQSGKPLTLSFAPDADLNPSNCERANCRRLIDVKE